MEEATNCSCKDHLAVSLPTNSPSGIGPIEGGLNEDLLDSGCHIRCLVESHNCAGR